MQVLTNPNYINLTIDFGSYNQVHTGANNTTKSIMVGAIYLRSSGECGGYHFMSLATGNQWHELNWTELSIGDYVIDRTEEMARANNESIMTNVYPVF